MTIAASVGAVRADRVRRRRTPRRPSDAADGLVRGSEIQYSETAPRSYSGSVRARRSSCCRCTCNRHEAIRRFLRGFRPLTVSICLVAAIAGKVVSRRGPTLETSTPKRPATSPIENVTSASSSPDMKWTPSPGAQADRDTDRGRRQCHPGPPTEPIDNSPAAHSTRTIPCCSPGCLAAVHRTIWASAGQQFATIARSGPIPDAHPGGHFSAAANAWAFEVCH